MKPVSWDTILIGTPGYTPGYTADPLDQERASLYQAIGADPYAAQSADALTAARARESEAARTVGTDLSWLMPEAGMVYDRGGTRTAQEQANITALAQAHDARYAAEIDQMRQNAFERAQWDVAAGPDTSAQDDAWFARRDALIAQRAAQESMEAADNWQRSLSEEDQAILNANTDTLTQIQARRDLRKSQAANVNSVAAQYGGAQDVALRSFDEQDRQRRSIATALAGQTRGVGRLGAQAQLAGNLSYQAGQSAAERDALRTERMRQGREQLGKQIDRDYSRESTVAKALQSSALNEYQAQLAGNRAGTNADIEAGQARQGFGKKVVGTGVTLLSGGAGGLKG